MVCNLFIVNMNKYVEFVKFIKDTTADIIEGVDKVLLDADVPVTDSVVKEQGQIKFDHETVRPMNSFLQNAKTVLGGLDKSNIGIAVTLGYVSRLQKFAKETDAAPSIINELDELQAALIV